MHVPDGFLDLPTSIATGAVAVVGIAVALPRARREAVDDRKAPMVGPVATVVFAAQMVNFPVGAGTSGHLMGGALAAVLVAADGPTRDLLADTALMASHGLELPWGFDPTLAPGGASRDGTA